MDDDKLFRFEDLEVWQRSADLAFNLDDVAVILEEKRRYRYAEQLRAASLSISNNIAEGSGSDSKNEFRNFLNFARRSSFECANMLIAFKRRGFVSQETVQPLLIELSVVCRMITKLRRSLE